MNFSLYTLALNLIQYVIKFAVIFLLLYFYTGYVYLIVFIDKNEFN